MCEISSMPQLEVNAPLPSQKRRAAARGRASSTSKLGSADVARRLVRRQGQPSRQWTQGHCSTSRRRPTAPRRPEHQAQRRQRHRCAHHPTPWLRSQPAQEKAHRAVLRLGQGDRPDPPSHGSGTGQSRSASDADDGSLQPHAAAYLGAPASAVHPMRAKDVEMVGSDRMDGPATGVLGAIGRFQNAA